MAAELNFPIGSKAPLDFGLREGGRRWDLPLHLWDAIFCSMTQQPPPHLRNDPYAKNILQKLSDVLNEGYRSESLQRRPHIVLLDTEFYKKRMLAELTEWMLLYIKDEIISAVDDSELREFLLRRKEAPKCKDDQQLQPVDWKLINLARDWLNVFLPHCLTKVAQCTGNDSS